MSNWAKQARMALSEKDFIRAGDFYKMADDPKAAIKAYLKGDHFVEAAKIWESIGNLKKAEKLLSKNGSKSELALFYLRQDDVDGAISLFLADGKKYEAAELLEDQGRLDEAAALYGQIGFYEKAGILFGKTKNVEKAIEMLNMEVSRLKTDESPAAKAKVAKFQDWIANLHIAARRFKVAGDMFLSLNQKEKAAKCFMKGGEALKTAKIFIGMGKLDYAKAALRQVQSLEAQVLLGRIAIEEKNFQEAITLLRDTNEHALLAKAFEEVGKLKEAARCLEALGESYKAASLYSRAKEHVKAALLFEQKGYYQEAAENYEKLKEYKRAAKLYEWAKNKFKCGYCLYKAGQFDSALTWLQEIDVEHPNGDEAQRIMAEIFFRQGLFSLAKTKLEELTSKYPLDDAHLKIYYLLARCLEEEHDTIAAQRYYERICSKKITYLDVKQRLSSLARNAPKQAGDTTLVSGNRTLRPQDFSPGQVIAERFRIIDLIGKGGMGSIFKVRDMILEREIALKMLLHSEGNREELKAELITARDLTHPYIIKVFDIGEWCGVSYFTMELVQGQTLKAYINSVQDSDFSERIQLIIKICKGLHAAHTQGVIHRDIKPQNILLGPEMNPKILDFGIAKKSTNQTKDKSISGSPKYMAPEQIKNEPCDARTDVYAMGIIMYYMFTKEEPFVGKGPGETLMMQIRNELPEPSKANPDIPYWLAEIIKKCCRKSPNIRFQDMEELYSELSANLMDLN